MNRRPTVLARLSWKFSHHPETVATEALGHILSESAAAREALRDFLRSRGADVGPVIRARTEVAVEDGGRPDLACSDRDGTQRLLIELKFWAGLTDKQPVTYLEQLPETGNSVLLVVAPSKRIETLWPELKRRVRDQMNVEASDEQVDQDVRRTTVESGCHLMLASWRVLLEALESRTSGAGDMQAVNDIRQLSGLVEVQDSEAFLPLRPEQLDPEIAGLIPKLHRLVRDVCTRVFGSDWADGRGYALAKSGGYYRFMSLGGCPVWFGLKYRPWSEFERTPLWVGFQKEARRRNVPWKLEQRWEEDPPYSLSAGDLVPIDLLTGCEYEEVLDDVVRQLKHLAGLFREIYAADAPD